MSGTLFCVSKSFQKISFLKWAVKDRWFPQIFIRITESKVFLKQNIENKKSGCLFRLHSEVYNSGLTFRVSTLFELVSLFPFPVTFSCNRQL